MSHETTAGRAAGSAVAAAGIVLLTLAWAQFVMALIALFFSRRIPAEQPLAPAETAIM